MKLPLFLQPVDTYERHWVVSRHLRRREVRSVLDVGGEGLLQRFLRGANCTTVNVEDTGDVQYDGLTLPFQSSSFDAVVSIDVLEHIPKEQRADFVSELLRVADREVVLAAPYGSDSHSELEQRALGAYREAHGRDHTYLREHVECGLPTLDELGALFRDVTCEFRFCGDCQEQFARFMRSLRSGGANGPRALRLVRSIFHIMLHANYWRVPKLDASPHEFSNRVYVFVTKESSAETIRPGATS